MRYDRGLAASPWVCYNLKMQGAEPPCIFLFSPAAERPPAAYGDMIAATAPCPPCAPQASREVRTVTGRLRRRILNAAEAEDITLGQASVLTRLSAKRGGTASELAAAEGVRHQSMTATVASLTALGRVLKGGRAGLV